MKLGSTVRITARADGWRSTVKLRRDAAIHLYSATPTIARQQHPKYRAPSRLQPQPRPSAGARFLSCLGRPRGSPHRSQGLPPLRPSDRAEPEADDLASLHRARSEEDAGQPLRAVWYRYEPAPGFTGRIRLSSTPAAPAWSRTAARHPSMVPSKSLPARCRAIPPPDQPNVPTFSSQTP